MNRNFGFRKTKGCLYRLSNRLMINFVSVFIFSFICKPTFFILKKKMEIGLWDHLAVCVSMNTWTYIYETWYAYHGSWAHLNGILHKSLSSVSKSIYVSLLIVAKQRLGRHVPVATNTRNNRRAHRLKESLWVCQCIPSIVTRQRLSKHVPAAMKNCWMCRFQRDPCGVKGK
jgi:hypothetical protein